MIALAPNELIPADHPYHQGGNSDAWAGYSEQAMSEENVEVVRAVLEAQRLRDWHALRRLYDPEIEWEDVSGLWGDWGMRRGFEDVREAFITWFQAFEEVRFDIDAVREAGGEVFASIRIRGRGRESGLAVSQEIPCVWTVYGGRVIRVRAYRDTAEALEAAGLRQ